MMSEQPNYGHGHVRKAESVEPDRFYLLVGLARSLTVTLVHVETRPYPDKNGVVWADTTEIRKLGKNYWTPKHRFSLRDVGILPTSANENMWNDAHCLLTTDAVDLEDRSGLDLLDPEQKKLLQAAVR